MSGTGGSWAARVSLSEPGAGIIRGLIAPLDRANVDTDAIFPKQYGRSTARSGYGAVLFDNWRYLDPGDLGSDHSQRRPNPDFVLNRPDLAGATVLLARDNFGCGSSREHAVWALRDFGLKAVLAPGFGDIFRGNCALNALAALVLAPRDVDQLFALCSAGPARANIDLHAGSLTAQSPHGAVQASFVLSQRERRLLVDRQDWIGATLASRDRVAEFEARRLRAMPWLARTLPGGTPPMPEH